MSAAVMLSIGSYTISRPVILAPMAGVTDLPFRKLCLRFGAGMAVSEMVHADKSLRDTRKSTLRRVHDSEHEPRVVQIAGSEPRQLAQAAQFNAAQGAQIIDINMGCPAKKVCKKAAGSALLADEALVADILREVVNAVDVPVTVKIRTGSSPEARNGVSIARIAEDAGIAAIAVHGRTRACAFKGQVEYDTIAQIVDAVDIPVIANGDIDSPAKAAQVMQHTQAAAVMIGRAAQGRPWLCGQIAAHLLGEPIPEDPSICAQKRIILAHVNELHQFYGDYLGLRIARKHVAWATEGLPGYRAFRAGFNAVEDERGQLAAIAQHYDDLNNKTREELAA